MLRLWSKSFNMLKLIRIKLGRILAIAAVFACAFITKAHGQDSLMLRIAEVDVDSIYLTQYLNILKKEAAASVHLETGVIAIVPMFDPTKPTQIRLLEIYANRSAYEAHLQSPHFKEYKSSTQAMVKSLKLHDMRSVDYSILPDIFRKLERK